MYRRGHLAAVDIGVQIMRVHQLLISTAMLLPRRNGGVIFKSDGRYCIDWPSRSMSTPIPLSYGGHEEARLTASNANK